MNKKTAPKYFPKEIEPKWPSSAKASEGQAKVRYEPGSIEKKWQKVWRKAGIYKFNSSKEQRAKGRESKTKNSSLSFTRYALGKKFYTLVELPYPSGDLHIGHWFTFVAPDVLSRFKRMQGYDVFFPMGYDAFGLPAENAAIKRGVHPKDWTLKNIETMTRQFEAMGTMIDWDHVTITCDPSYYTWNQWIFLKMYEKGLAYRGKTLSNWCPTDQTVLANEHVENGKCWRCGSTVIQKEVEQWFLKITDYAERLLWDEKGNGIDWPKSVMVAQNEWIGKSEGLLIEFSVILGSGSRIKNQESRIDSSPSAQNDKEKIAQNEIAASSPEEKPRNDDLSISVFTTRPETIDGCTFIAIAPEHTLVEKILKYPSTSLRVKVRDDKIEEQVHAYIQKSLNKLEQERLADAKEKTGIDTGYKAINPVTGREIPIYIADYVLGNYGTGAVMGVPFADKRDREFANAMKLPVIETSFHARPEGKKKTLYHLRDWSVSRQRYWGTPVPMIHCDTDGIVPVPLEDLPVTLPYDVDYQPKGKAPLASNEAWMKVKCPKCKKVAKRDPETLDTFFDSSWYYYRYVDPKYDKAPFDSVEVAKLMPVDIYFGGGEHTLGHTLYARFFTKFFKDAGMVDFDEFAIKRVQHGIVLGTDGNKMSKSRGNVINPDDVAKEFGTDAVRVYLSFMMPYNATGPWSTTSLYGMFRFLKRVWELQTKVHGSQSAVYSKKTDNRQQKTDNKSGMTREDLFHMHTAIKKVTEDIQDNKHNTAIAAIMKWLNYLDAKETIAEEEFRNLLIILSPFAPHITEELWQLQKLSDNKAGDFPFHSIHQEKWPTHDDSLIVSDTVVIAVQVNGKLRDIIVVQSAKCKVQSEVEKIALQSEKVTAHMEGKTVKKVIYVPGKLINFVAS